MCNWAIQFNIPLTALTSLLKYLHWHGHPNLPKSSKKLLNTPNERVTFDVPPGKYCHIGVGLNICRILDKFSVENLPNSILLDFNIDGLPISKSTNSMFWVIMGNVVQQKFNCPFIIGVYHGYKKPNDFNQFLAPFVSEMKTILNEFRYKTNNITVNIRSFICDAPARASVLYTKSHSGYYSCGKCVQRGKVIKNRMVFLEKNSQKRTNESFRSKTQQMHHNGSSCLEELPIDLIVQFPLDYMHVVCLGVVKKMLYIILMGDYNSPKLTKNQLLLVSQRLKICSLSQPQEFARRFRSLSELSYYKATELRNIILYGGPVIFSNVIPEEKYNNFLKLHVAISILCDPVFSNSKVDKAELLLNEFVTEFANLYGKHNIVYNFHSLLHLADDVKRFGSLDSYGAFPFESNMFRIKKTVTKS